MSKQKSSSSPDTAATDTDPAASGDAAATGEKESGSALETAALVETEAGSKADEKPQDAGESVDPDAVSATETDSAETGTSDSDIPASASSATAPAATAKVSAATTDQPPPPPKSGRPWFTLFNFLLIVALAGAAGYYWREQQKLDAAYQADIADLRQQLNQKATSDQLQSRLQASLQSGLAPLEGELGNLDRKINELDLGQKSLRESSETLYELFGRDRNDWQLAEVEYLMRVAQHQLILQDDFEGAAITLQAASDRIGLTGDPGLLPVRVKISEEIADLKTRQRPDLVGMTLVLAQLQRQVRALKPGFAVRVDQPVDSAPSMNQLAADDWLARFNAFLNSLISIRKESSDPSEIEANVVDVASALEDNLKLARWSVLERDARQYQLLLERSLRLFREFYDLDDAANNDFMRQLQELEKMVINPEKPDITGSLREMQRILSQRENAPAPAVEPAAEPVAGETNG
jgi:uroporphyrin-III C-methyltransferase